jgi:hypothetical protein
MLYFLFGNFENVITFAPAFRAEFRRNDGKSEGDGQPVKAGER